MKVKAAVINEVGAPYVIEDLVLGDLRADEVIIRMVASGICHTDEALRIGDSQCEFPSVFGHEGAGIIEEVGSDVQGFEIGDQVILTYNSCGTCINCKQGKPYSCDKWRQLNRIGTRLDGSHLFYKEDGTPVKNLFMQSSFSTYSIVNKNSLVKVSKDIDIRFLGPLGCGILTGSGTVNDVFKPSIGSSIVIFGTGAVGMGAIMTAKIHGCNPIIAVDIVDSKLQLAKELGATHTINSLDNDTKKVIMDLTDNRGVDFSIDTTGLSIVMEQAIDVLTDGGINVPLAVTKNKLEINTTKFVSGLNRSIVGVKMGRNIPQIAIPNLIGFYEQDKFPIEKLIEFYKFEDINQANEDVHSGKIIKPILIIDEEYRKESPLV